MLQTSRLLFNVPLDTDTGIESHAFSVCGRVARGTGISSVTPDGVEPLGE